MEVYRKVCELIHKICIHHERKIKFTVPVEMKAVVETLLSKINKVVCGDGHSVGKEFDGEGT